MRTIYSIMLLFIATGISFSQSERFRIGFTGGPTFSEFTSDSDYPKSGRQRTPAGYQAGAFVQFHADKRLSYRAGLLWSHTTDFDRGRLYLGTFGDQLFEREYRHEDIMIPVEVIVGFSRKPNRFYLSGGVTPALKIKRQVVETQWWSDSDPGMERMKTDITNQQHYRTVDLFAAFGLGYTFRLGERAGMFIEPKLRSNLPGNLINIGTNDYDWPEFKNPTIYSICIETGLFFNTGKQLEAN